MKKRLAHTNIKERLHEDDCRMYLRRALGKSKFSDNKIRMMVHHSEYFTLLKRLQNKRWLSGFQCKVSWQEFIPRID